MKHNDLKKTLILLCVFGFLVFILLFWQQTPAIDGQSFVQIYKRFDSSKEKKIYQPQWSWKCTSQHCERTPIDEKTTPVSYATCSMLCGSTQLWPQPTGPVTLSARSVTLNHQQIIFKLSAEQPAVSLVSSAIEVFKENIESLIQRRNYTEFKTDIDLFIVHLHIIDSKEVKLKLKTNESYTLTVKPKGNIIEADITGQTFFGVRHGLETLSQLIWWDEYSNNGMLRVLKGASIHDAPVFVYRGLMIDTARNYMPLENLKRVIVGMSSNKLNVFHWHITDSQSFPLFIPELPHLAKTGAYGPDMTYTPEDIKELVNFALVRGVRVIIEVDTPAHSGNGWTWGPAENLGELAVCVNKQPWSVYCGEPPCGQLNPENPKVFDVLEKIYRNIIELTGETEIFHIGGDEVNLECWASHLSSETLLKYPDLHDLWGDFTKKLLKHLEKANNNKEVPNIIVWSSNLSKRPYIYKYFNKTNVIVQSWGASQWPDSSDLTTDGYKIVISHVDAWYLDCGFGRWRETGDAACDPYKSWQTVYSHRPWAQPIIKRKQVVGGEACLWTEQVDKDSLDSRLWPRGAAFAERLWSDPITDLLSYNIQEDVYTRLVTQRDRLVSRGLLAEAMWPLWCSQNPGMCL